ncbi:Shr3 amino acid permease chaperone [Ceraceosorus bombacis]|uniref:Shr3 amino acid permease chaperone n=1 Tax=Ceraceosorus bombacis TaxID=401625 RepID=A0A0P1BBV3_9BASI|nr:Shr3 amino acid permease chaperone [Ceraceosorus bombacis]
MGFRTGFVLSAVAFQFGVIYMASIYDFPLLYGSSLSSTEGLEAADRAEFFYLGLFKAPAAVPALLHGMIGLGIVGLLAKLHRWTEIAKWFDGAAIVLYVGALSMYLTVSMPTIRLLADPNNEALLARSSLATQRSTLAARAEAGQLDATLVPSGPLTASERVDALRIIGATNTIIIVLLAGVLLMQGTEWWLERAERLEKKAIRDKEMSELKLSKAGKDQ